MLLYALIYPLGVLALFELSLSKKKTIRIQWRHSIADMLYSENLPIAHTLFLRA